MGSPLQHPLRLPPKMHWPKVFWVSLELNRIMFLSHKQQEKSSSVRPPWFFKNPQLALCLPQCPGLAAQHHALLCP